MAEKKKKVEECIDVSAHKLIPKHSKLTDDDKTVLLEKYNISLSQLPKIARKDPAVIKLEVEVGDVIKIVRPSLARGEVDYFRVVI